jgi:hypothetical protein
MENEYLIPANSKRSLLIFNMFTEFDLILFGSGTFVSLILLLVIPLDNLILTIIALLPGLVCGFLVAPIPNYHNFRTLIKEMYIFYSSRQKYVWKGWCFIDEEFK